MVSLPTDNWIGLNFRTEGEGKQFLEDIRDYIAQMMGGDSAESITIASGSISPSKALVRVGGESDTADTLTAIDTTNLPDGSIIVLIPEDGALEPIKVQHSESPSAYEISLANGDNYILDEEQKRLVLIRYSDYWEELFRTPELTAVREKRSVFTWVDADEITISPGCYWHHGTARQHVYWDSNLTFQITVTTGAAHWRYIYLSDTAIAAADTRKLTATEITHNTTAPTYNVEKGGWHNGSDLCIFAVRLDDANAVVEFYHCGSRDVIYADMFGLANGITPGDTWTDVAAVLPDWGDNNEALVIFRGYYVSNYMNTWWRKNGSSAASGQLLGLLHPQSVFPESRHRIVTDENGIFEVRGSVAGANDKISIYQVGYTIPVGM